MKRRRGVALFQLLALLESELRGTLDLNKLMDPDKLKRPEDEW